MLPVSAFDKTECLESLVGIRTGCTVDKAYPFFIEDIEGVDIKTLSNVARGSDPSGKEFAKRLINSAAREMLANIEVMLNNGYKLKDLVGDMCSSCTLLPVYTANAGIKVTTAIASRFKTLRITKLTMLINQTGDFQIVIDDGVTPVTYTPSFVSGALTMINIDYQTSQKSVNIYFTDITVGLGQVSCPVQSSCGCGKSALSDNPVVVSGIINQVETSIQYGFIPCAAIGCSYDQLVCSLVKQTPNILGLALMYKVGEKYYLNKLQGERNNETVSINEKDQPDMMRNFPKLYKDTLFGTPQSMGIKKVINDYLSDHKSDRCIICDSKIKTGYAVG